MTDNLFMDKLILLFREEILGAKDKRLRFIAPVVDICLSVSTTIVRDFDVACFVDAVGVINGVRDIEVLPKVGTNRLSR